MDFFQKHDKALRKGRLLQAATTFAVAFPDATFGEIVDLVLRIEKTIEEKTDAKKEN